MWLNEVAVRLMRLGEIAHQAWQAARSTTWNPEPGRCKGMEGYVLTVPWPAIRDCEGAQRPANDDGLVAAALGLCGAYPQWSVVWQPAEGLPIHGCGHSSGSRKGLRQKNNCRLWRCGFTCTSFVAFVVSLSDKMDVDHGGQPIHVYHLAHAV